MLDPVSTLILQIILAGALGIIVCKAIAIMAGNRMERNCHRLANGVAKECGVPLKEMRQVTRYLDNIAKIKGPLDKILACLDFRGRTIALRVIGSVMIVAKTDLKDLGFENRAALLLSAKKTIDMYADNKYVHEAIENTGVEKMITDKIIELQKEIDNDAKKEADEGA